jgi:hypothetical protein
MQQNPVGRASAETRFHSSYYLRERGKNVSLISISRTIYFCIQQSHQTQKALAEPVSRIRRSVLDYEILL